MKTHTSLITVFLCLLHTINAYYTQDELGNDVDFADEAYSYFQENELDDDYEHQNEANAYELMANDDFGKLSLMDLEEEEDELPVFLQVADDDFDDDTAAFFQTEADDLDFEAYDDDTAAFFQTGTDDVDFKEFDDAGDMFDDVVVVDDNGVEPGSSSYQPIKQRKKSIQCDEKQCTIGSEESVDNKKTSFSEMEAKKEGGQKKNNGYMNGGSRIMFFLLLLFILVICYTCYKRGYLSAIKHRICNLFGHPQAEEPVLPQTNETEPLVAN
ncbi:hypothetical protein BaOVIS_032410 [Babesia ovis]|uniref:Uncharacterized protein n=1 Tax=Babesia ovis TaxID=5869 RepID=A0A9W5TCP5_BABOV|nr:hypothetical protein BaOVIS_032410 [Babesia ovis]